MTMPSNTLDDGPLAPGPALPDPLPILLAAAASQRSSPVTPHPSTEVDTDDGG